MRGNNETSLTLSALSDNMYFTLMFKKREFLRLFKSHACQIMVSRSVVGPPKCDHNFAE